MFISASKDTTARLFDVDSLECHKIYQTERPVNSASISPTQDHVSWKIETFGCEENLGSNSTGPKTGLRLSFLFQVVLGGGQEAMDVTTTSTRIGKFDARFFHMVFEVSAKIQMRQGSNPAPSSSILKLEDRSIEYCIIGQFGRMK